MDRGQCRAHLHPKLDRAKEQEIRPAIERFSRVPCSWAVYPLTQVVGPVCCRFCWKPCHDHYDFDNQDNNFTAAVDEYVPWGFFDYRCQGENFDAGYQSPPVNWGLSSPCKRGFFALLSTITGQKPHP
jgi:hypothetical protein